MAKAKKTTLTPLVITRLFNAPRRAVWKAWTEPEKFKKWWGPNDYSCPYSEIDLRVGGTYLNCMRSKEGKDLWSTGRYLEVIPMQKILCTDSFSDENGNVVPASYYGMNGDLPLEMQVSVTLHSKGTQTEMRLEHLGFKDDDMKSMASKGWNESFDKMEKVLA